MLAFDEKEEFRLVWYVNNEKHTSRWFKIGKNTQIDLNRLAWNHEQNTGKFTWLEYR